ncbi:MAG: glycine cleavage system aminomethyltransferase GcvT, partial [Bdellovibrionales bacterium]|nr:glycine cleavage system aminomethyltransferase GcvT [Bdellovibrionales bacterium]
ISAGAKMVDFAGWEMPIQYKGIMSEHNAVREKVGIFDVSHMGEIEVQGPQALEFCQLISTNDVSTLEPGRVQYSCFLDRKGGIIDDCTLYQLGKDHYLFVVNAASKDRVLDWFVTNSIEGAQVKDQSDRYALIALQGKNAEPLLSKVVHKNLSSIEYYGFAWIEHEGHAVMVSRTGYTGEDGFELYIPWDHAQALWNVLLSEGQEYGIQAVGLGARDTLRLEMGYLLYGQDMSMDTNPIEAGLQWICKMNKGTFIGKEAILAVKEKGPEKKLRALQLMGKGVPRSGYKVYEDTREIGQLSSGTFSPSIKSGIALGYLPSEYRLGSIVQIDLRGKRIPAKLVKGPFVSPSTKKSS